MTTINTMRRRTAVLFGMAIAVHSVTIAQGTPDSVQRMIVNFTQYVSMGPLVAPSGAHHSTLIEKEEVPSLVVKFDRSALPRDSGPQFLKVVTTVWTQDGHLIDNVTQFAFTFPKSSSPARDAVLTKDYARQIMQFGFIRPGAADSLQIAVDTLPDWGRIRVEVMSDEEYTKYIGRMDTRLIWNYTIRGGLIQSWFSIGIPKVLYDSRARDTVNYGNVSAHIRFHYRDQSSGELFPLSAGFGVYGVGSPVDVTSQGGGFLLSLFFDIIQFLRNNNVDVTDKASAGLELAPFFPAEHRPRIILSARIAYTP